MKPLKVLILITKANWGGAQRYVFDVATGLPKDRFSVEVMAGSEGVLTEKLSAAGVFASGTLEVGRDVSFTGDVKAAFKLIQLLRIKKPDILHVNSSKIGGVGAFAGRLAGVPRIVFTVHGWAFNENRPLAQKLAIKFLYWVTIMLSHEVMVVSEAARAQVRYWPLIQKKLSVVHNGVPSIVGFSRANARLELTRMNEAVRKAAEGRSESNLIWLGTIAELHHIKGHEYAIRAVASCIDMYERANPSKKIIYTIMSDGEERQKLQTLINELTVQDRIILMGRVPDAAQYIKAFDVFVLASLSEALGYVLIESGMAGVPVVATAVGGIPEVIDDMYSGILVQPKNIRELTHAVSFVLEHPKEAREYGAHLKESTQKRFSLPTMLERIQTVYTRKTAPETSSL
ncbi:MAG TPA: glycosyltransferase [Candidatus Paceibacterota bacterium]